MPAPFFHRNALMPDAGAEPAGMGPMPRHKTDESGWTGAGREDWSLFLPRLQGMQDETELSQRSPWMPVAPPPPGTGSRMPAYDADAMRVMLDNPPKYATEQGAWYPPQGRRNRLGGR